MLNEDKENDIRYYQYTAIDEYSRQRVVMEQKNIVHMNQQSLLN